MIWSSLARNRSASPVVSGFFGRIVPSDAAKESRLAAEGNRKNEFARFQGLNPQNPAISKPPEAGKLNPNQSLSNYSRATNKVVASVPIGQAPQAITYVPDAVPEGAGTQGLVPLGVAGQAAHFTMASPDGKVAEGVQAPTSVTLFDQGLVQVLEASATGLEPKHSYVLALSNSPDGAGKLEDLASFMTNPAGAAIVNAIGPIRQLVQGEDTAQRRYLVIAPGTADDHGASVQVQRE